MILTLKTIIRELTWKLKVLKHTVLSFKDRMDDLNRRVDVENTLWKAVKEKRSIPPEECKKLALKLGVPTWVHTKSNRPTK